MRKMKLDKINPSCKCLHFIKNMNLKEEIYTVNILLWSFTMRMQVCFGTFLMQMFGKSAAFTSKVICS